MELHGCKGCGSVVVEALLELAGASYTRSIFDWSDRAAWDRLRAINPLAQVPTLVLDDGTVLTESAGIALWVADRFPDAHLLPDEGSARALAYRWLVFFATNVYGPIIVGDFPERWVDGEAAHASLKEHAVQRARDAWLAFEERRTGALSAGSDDRRARRLCGDDLALAARSRVDRGALSEGARCHRGNRASASGRVGVGAQLHLIGSARQSFAQRINRRSRSGRRSTRSPSDIDFRPCCDDDTAGHVPVLRYAIVAASLPSLTSPNA